MNGPMTVADWERYQRTTALLPDVHGRIDTEAEVIRGNADWLIANLYDPDPEVGARASKRIADLGLDDEAINWGDLSASVGRRAGRWLVVIEEAAPDCPVLRAYIRDWLQRWGWVVDVETLW